MSNLIYRDGFSDLRNWTGTGYLDLVNYFTETPGVQPEVLTSKRTFFDAEKLSIRFYDLLGDQYLSLTLNGREILKVSGNETYYTVTEEGVVSDGVVNRSSGWHLLEIEIRTNYRVKVDGTTIYNTVHDSRQAFNVVISGGIWDDFELSRPYSNDYAGGTGSLDDLEIQSADLSDELVEYSIKPGYFYSDNIEYYHFANMGIYDFSPDPSGVVVGVSGLPYIPGQPYFIVSEDDIPSESGYVRTPVNRSYSVSWDQEDENSYIPTISGAFDNHLVYECGTSRDILMDTPIDSTRLVLSDEGGTPASVRSESSYIDYVKVGNAYQTFAEVLDIYGGPVEGVTVTWYRVSAEDEVTDVATAVTNSNGIATGSIVVTEDESFHVYAEVNPTSQPRWIQVQHPVSLVLSSVFQLDNDTVLFDSQEGTAAVGYNIWHEEWGTNKGEGTGLSYPNPTTHGQWEDLHLELQRPPITTNTAVNEASGAWNGSDFRGAYPSIVDSIGTVITFMNPMYVARNGYWGQLLISGADIRSGSPTIPAGQVLNPATTYEIDRDYGVTTGSYTTVQTAVGAYDSVYYVFYQPGSEYSGSNVDLAGDFYFRGVAVYEEDLSQVNSQVQDIISESRLQE